MTDPTFSPQDFLKAEIVVSSLAQNLAIQFQMEGLSWTREIMLEHVRHRAALSIVAKLLLDEGERLLKS